MRTVETLIFPRYHQWDCVRRLEDAARAEGPGHSYLVEHSAGSGKSNTIAWTAHRLSTLHDVVDSKVFDQVIVITDRVVLDRQLQDTIFQFEHVHGVVRKIDESSAQLADALGTGEARIIVTTLQKFPVILDRVADLGDRSYAVIVDEAHSSQTGEAAKALKQVLGAGADEAALLAAEEEDAAAEAASDPDELLLSLAARGRQPNLSYFAFTATPKPRTLELFGRKGDDGVHHPFHLYSMRQAIEERFILDVLENYSTYSTFYKLAKTLEDDPQVAKAQAAAAIAKFVSLHPSNIAQRVQIIVEHFRTVTRTKIGGRGKAMVVTRSRLHAVKYRQAIDRYLEAQGYGDIRALVAFSGTVTDELGLDHTETQMNGFGEKELPDKFTSETYGILVVAEKYQTGYDQPLLHTMYVDKKLEGVKAVQTLSRLNRIHPGKDETFVLDFVNDAETIRKGFEPFYRETLAAPTDPNVLFDAADVLRQADVIRDEDVDAFVAVLLKPAAAVSPGDQAKLYAATDPAVERWAALSPDEREAFREALKRYLHAYAFLSQIVPVLGSDQEKLYLYGRFLATRIRRDRDPGIEVSDHVQLTHLRIQHSGSDAIELGEGAEPGVALPGGGEGGRSDPPVGFLSEVIQALNERFSIDFTKADALFVEQVVEEAVEDEQLAQQARVNTMDNFRFGFNKAFEDLVLERHASNAEIIERLADPRVYETIRDLVMREVYDRLKSA
jgi:type I restriction enzyme R subunit